MNYWFYYWRHYKRDIKNGFIYRLNQSAANMEDVRQGDVVWVVARPSTDYYCLAAKMLVVEAGENPPGLTRNKHGRYFAKFDEENSQYFNPFDKNNEISTLIRSLPTTYTRSAKLGLAFQGDNGVKKLSLDEHRKIQEFSNRITLLLTS